MEVKTIVDSSTHSKVVIEEEDKNKSLLDRILSDIKRDTCNLKFFWKKHKNTIFWILITFLVLQYIDILSLGANFTEACQKKGIIQKGGQEGAPAAPSPTAPAAPTTPEAPKGNESNKKDKDKKDKDKKDKKDKKDSNNDNNNDEGKKKKGKANKGGYFQSFRTTGPLGNILGRFGTIFQNAFKILGVILLIAIIGFLPIIVMIYLTYKVIKYMVGNVKML